MRRKKAFNNSNLVPSKIGIHVLKVLISYKSDLFNILNDMIIFPPTFIDA